MGFACHSLIELFTCDSLFTESPPTKELFGFPITIDPSSKDLLDSRRFKMHSAYMIQMLDTALGMLGPDIELLSDILLELGSKHERYGVKPEMFMVMGKSLNHALSKVLGKSFDAATQEAWKETYAELSNDMIRAQKKRS